MTFEHVDVRSTVDSWRRLLEEKNIPITLEHMNLFLSKSRWFVESVVKVGWIYAIEKEKFPPNSLGCSIDATVSIKELDGELNLRASSSNIFSLPPYNSLGCVNKALIFYDRDRIVTDILKEIYGLETMEIPLIKEYDGSMKQKSIVFYDAEKYPMPVMTLEQAPLYMYDSLMSGYARCLLEGRPLLEE